MTDSGVVSPKQRFTLIIEPTQLAALQAIEERTGARLSEQIRRAIQAYLDTQTVIPKEELTAILSGKSAKKK
jgi:hypothetical protein